MFLINNEFKSICCCVALSFDSISIILVSFNLLSIALFLVFLFCILLIFNLFDGDE